MAASAVQCRHLVLLQTHTEHNFIIMTILLLLFNSTRVMSIKLIIHDTLGSSLNKLIMEVKQYTKVLAWDRNDRNKCPEERFHCIHNQVYR